MYKNEFLMDTASIDSQLPLSKKQLQKTQIVYEDNFTVEFKSGVTVDIEG